MIPYLLLRAWGVRPWGIADIDWDVVLAVALGIGAAATAWLEHRRASRLDDVAVDLTERLAVLEAVAAHRDDVVALNERLNSFDAPDITQLAERVAAVAERQVGHAERIAVLEARADFAPWRHTRRKDGKFARIEEAGPVGSGSGGSGGTE